MSATQTLDDLVPPLEHFARVTHLRRLFFDLDQELRKAHRALSSAWALLDSSGIRDPASKDRLAPWVRNALYLDDQFAEAAARFSHQMGHLDTLDLQDALEKLDPLILALEEIESGLESVLTSKSNGNGRHG
jgi:hypothetical protein